ncbi:MAG: serine/threonine-protein kinase [Anaerolineae bacterium]
MEGDNAPRNGLLAAGTVLKERYRIVELVGEGGGGAVYKADDTRLVGRITAVKEIRPDPAQGEALRRATQDQFRREASTLARLDHPALPKVSDYFSTGPFDYLVMDFVDGQDLRQVVDEAQRSGDTLGEAQVLDWMRQLLDAVAYLHAQSPPVLHRDIKPANVKLAGQRVKLVDFGLVKPLDPADPRTLTVARGLGSLPYTPLEQYAGETGHTDVRADIYALGATLYHLLTGRPPVTAQERFLLPNALERPRSLRRGLSPRTEGAILAAMALHPQRRPPDVAALRDLLFGHAPLEADPELMTNRAAWHQAAWDNLGLFALAGLLLLLAVLATWQAVP